MKKRWIFIKLIVFCAILGYLLHISGQVLILKAGTGKYNGFYQEKNDFDILFFGSSRVLDAVQPMELWDEYGLRSYNMAQHSENLARNYWQIKNALQNHKPKLAVVDISVFFGDYVVDAEKEDSRAYLHKQIDHMPMSLNKWQAIKAMVPAEIRAEYVWPFILYHSRWNTLSNDDFYSTSDSRLGAEVRTNIMPQEKVEWLETERAEIFDPKNVNLDRIVELCKDHGVQLLFVCMPCNENAAVFSTLNCFEDYFAQNGIAYWNLAKEEHFLDYRTDFSDTSHVNVSGSKKITDHFGAYYLDHYEVSSMSADTAERWNQYLQNYKKDKDLLIMSSYNLPETLVMLANSDNDYVAELIADEESLQRIPALSYYPNISVTYSEEPMLEIKIYRVGEADPFAVYRE